MTNNQGGKVFKYLVTDGAGATIAKYETLAQAKAFAGKSWFIYKLIG